MVLYIKGPEGHDNKAAERRLPESTGRKST